MSEKMPELYSTPLGEHQRLMDEIQAEWEENKEYHTQQRHMNIAGIRSSQISALVAVLLNKGILKAKDTK